MKIPNGCLGCRNCAYFNGGIKSNIKKCMYYNRNIKTVRFSIVQPYMKNAEEGTKVRKYPCFALRGLYIDGMAIKLKDETKQGK